MSCDLLVCRFAGPHVKFIYFILVHMLDSQAGQ